MSKLQDELAWLNHRLDHQLEEWRKLHRLHGRISYLLLNLFLILVLTAVFFCLLLLRNDKCGTASPALFAGSLDAYFLAIATLMAALLVVLNGLKWMLYSKLLQDGHDLKSKIYIEHVSENQVTAESLKDFQDSLKDGLRRERRFPFPMEDANTPQCQKNNLSSGQLNRETNSPLFAWLKSKFTSAREKIAQTFPKWR
jgi:hypothetical protein